MKDFLGALLALIMVCFAVACGAANATPSPTPTSTPLPPPVTAEPAAPTLTPLPSETPVNMAAPSLDFDGDISYEYLQLQMSFGPDRWPGTEGHQKTGDFIAAELAELGWQVEIQPFTYNDVAVRNIIGKANIGRGPVVIIGAHYDTRRIADQTAGAVQNELSVPGAVDGASGVAVLLELARTIDLDEVPREIWLAFFDAEDNGSGGIPNWDWIAGSTHMANNLTVTPEAMVLVDMVGDADQQLYYEGNSNVELRERLWEIAAMLGHGDYFIPELRHTMIDDHLPFARLGIPAVDIIDFDYPYWHTVEDTADKASPESLWRVGQTIEYWLETDLE